MWKALVPVLAGLATISPLFAQSDAFERGMNTMWEVLWHQSGVPTRLVRWEQDLKVSISGVNVEVHREHTLNALRDVAAETGRQVVDVTGTDEAAQANVKVEITPDTGLQDSQPCETRLFFRTETAIDSVSMQMRNRDARRCAYHEAMHVMGVRGHPEGATVLSYFTHDSHKLQPLDKAMLRAWYSPRTRAGMTPLEVLPIMADELVAVLPDKKKAAQSRDRFLLRTVQQMQAFANGQADVPPIVRKSGKASEAGVQFGRMEMSYFLGLAYMEGGVVKQDPTQAMRWLQRAASMGSRTAQARLGTASASMAAPEATAGSR